MKSKDIFYSISFVLLIAASCGADNSINSSAITNANSESLLFSDPDNGNTDSSLYDSYRSIKEKIPLNVSLRKRLSGKIVGAHQGGAISLAGNTLKQFKKAYQKGAQVVEMDLRLTKDGVAIVFHDEKLNLLTNCKGFVKEKTWNEIKDCTKLFFYKISTFEDILKWDFDGRVVINAEFKSKDVIVEALNLVTKYKAHNWVFFQTKGYPAR
jgi:hypothetical protein